MIKHDNLILFDGICNLCNGVVKFIIKRDAAKKFTFTPLQSDYGKYILETYKLPTDNFDTFVYIRNGECLIKSKASLYVLYDLGWPWRMLFIFTIIPSLVLDKVYNVVAKNRHKRLGKRRHCMVPKPAHKNRFIESIS